MKTKDPAKYLEHFVANDQLGKLFGVKYLSITNEECLCEYTAKPEHFNPTGILHGGALFSVMDSCQGSYLHFFLDEKFRVAATGTATVRYHAPVTQGTIRIRSWLKGSEGRKFFINSSATNAEGVQVASLEEIWIAMLKNP